MPRATARETMVSSVVADDHQSERRSGARDREGGCTAIEEIDDRCIPQDQRIEPAVILVALEGSDWRCCDRDRRHQQGIEPRRTRSDARDQQREWTRSKKQKHRHTQVEALARHCVEVPLTSSCWRIGRSFLTCWRQFG